MCLMKDTGSDLCMQARKCSSHWDTTIIVHLVIGVEIADAGLSLFFNIVSLRRKKCCKLDEQVIHIHM